MYNMYNDDASNRFKYFYMYKFGISLYFIDIHYIHILPIFHKH